MEHFKRFLSILSLKESEIQVCVCDISEKVNAARDVLWVAPASNLSLNVICTFTVLSEAELIQS
jgi:hypothetical protein